MSYLEAFARIAGLTEGSEEAVWRALGDADGVRRFCEAWLSEQGREPVRDAEHSTTRYSGFAGFPLCDEGYEFMAKLPGWRVVSTWGEWPYHIAFVRSEDRAALVYCEGDLTLEVADDGEAWKALIARYEEELNRGNG